MPPEVRDFVEERRGAGDTSEEAHAKAREKYPEIPAEAWPSRSKFAAHIAEIDRTAERVKIAQSFADRICGRLDEPQSRTAKAISQVLQSILVEALGATTAAGEIGEPVKIDLDTVHSAAKTLNVLVRTDAIEQQMMLQLKHDLAAKQNPEVDRIEATLAQGQETGLSAERVALLQAQVAGLRIDPQRPVG